MKQAGENSNSLKMVFRNRPENEKIVRTTAAVFASIFRHLLYLYHSLL